MTKKPNTKRALVLSTLCLLLCVSMLIGTTFAWFTDTDTTATANIVSGTLDIEIVDANGNEKTDALMFVDANNGTNILWEPGATFRTQQFAIKNTGSLHLKYKVEVNNTDVSHNKLNEVISFSLVDANGSKVELSTMQDVSLAPKTTTGLYYIEGHMDQNAGNEYQGLTLSDISITVYAAQNAVEFDSDDNQYDADAVYAVVNSEKLNEAISNAQPGDTIQLGNGTLELSKVEKSVSIAGNGAENTTVDVGTGLTLDADDVTISGVKIEGTFSGRTAAISTTSANTTISGIELVDTSAFYGVQNDISAGNLIVENTKIIANERAIYDYYSNAETITIKDCYLDAIYPFNSNNENPNIVLTVENSTLNGWTSYGNIKSATFVNTKFGASVNYGYAYLRPYATTTLTNCDFSSGFEIDATKTTDSIILTNCTLAGVPLTTANAGALFGGTIPANVTIN